MHLYRALYRRKCFINFAPRFACEFIWFFVSFFLYRNFTLRKKYEYTCYTYVLCLLQIIEVLLFPKVLRYYIVATAATTITTTIAIAPNATLKSLFHPNINIVQVFLSSIFLSLSPFFPLPPPILLFSIHLLLINIFITSLLYYYLVLLRMVLPLEIFLPMLQVCCITCVCKNV